MQHVDIRFGEGSIPEVGEAEEIIHLANDAPGVIFSGLKDGMSSGKPSIAIVIPLDAEKKRLVVWELSWEMFNAIHTALGGQISVRGW